MCACCSLSLRERGGVKIPCCTHGNDSCPHPATSQPCLYNYTIGTALAVVVTQSVPVCLICSNTSNTQWSIGTGGTLSGIAGAPYILYVTTPTTTFLPGPNVNCFQPPGQSNRFRSLGKWMICVFLHAINVTMSSSHSANSSSSCPSTGDLCQRNRHFEPGL